jgi:hypothetical protein
MAADVYVGLAVTSHFNGILAKAIFENVSISVPSVSVDSQKDIVPLSFRLKQNYPNPFNPGTSIGYSLAGSGRVHLVVYDIKGRIVTILEDVEKSAGEYIHYWEAVDTDGNRLPSGIYFYCFKTDFYSKTMKMILMH